MKIDGNQIKVGNILEINSKLWRVLKTQHTQPGKGGAYLQVEMKEIREGTKMNERFRSSESVERAILDEKICQYLYSENNKFIFMDNTTYEQIEINSSQMGDATKWLTGQEICEVVLWNNQPILVSPPAIVELKIINSEPCVKGDTVYGATKNATLETGIDVQVALFVNENEVIKVDTRDITYVGRAKS